jgi:hypothetical protein
MNAGGVSQQRRDPQPMAQGWELAVAAIGGVLLALGLAALLGLGTASALFGRGWVWPHGTTVIGQVLGGLLTGHPGRGLNPTESHLIAGPAAVYLCVALCELTVAAGAIVGGIVVARHRRPGDARRGMASRPEAEAVLGLSALRAARHIIRPDLTEPARPRPCSRRRRRRAHPAQPSTDAQVLTPTECPLDER